MKSAVSLPTVGVASPAPRRTTVSTALAAVGIVFGDLGTSPLYTYRKLAISIWDSGESQIVIR
jgi:K+ transporter